MTIIGKVELGDLIHNEMYCYNLLNIVPFGNNLLQRPNMKNIVLKSEVYILNFFLRAQIVEPFMPVAKNYSAVRSCGLLQYFTGDFSIFLYRYTLWRPQEPVAESIKFTRVGVGPVDPNICCQARTRPSPT